MNAVEDSFDTSIGVQVPPDNYTNHPPSQTQNFVMNPHPSWLPLHQIERLPNQFNNGIVPPNHISNGSGRQDQLMTHQDFLAQQANIAHGLHPNGAAKNLHILHSNEIATSSHQHPQAIPDNCSQFLVNKDNFPINIDEPNTTSEHIQRSNNNVAYQQSIPQVPHFDQPSGMAKNANAHHEYQFSPYRALEKHQGYHGGTNEVVNNCGKNGNFRGNVHFHNAHHQFHVESTNHSNIDPIVQANQLAHRHRHIEHHSGLGNQYDQLNQSNKNQLVDSQQHLPIAFKREPIFVDLTSDDENEQAAPESVLPDNAVIGGHQKFNGGFSGLPNHQFPNYNENLLASQLATSENNAKMNLNPNIRSYGQPTHPHPHRNSNQCPTQDFESKNQSVTHGSILGSNSELGNPVHHVHQTEKPIHWEFSEGTQPYEDHFPGHFNHKLREPILGRNEAHQSQSDWQGHQIPSLHHQGHMPNHAPFHRNNPVHQLGVGSNKEPYQFSQQGQFRVNEQHFGQQFHKNIYQSSEQNPSQHQLGHNPDFENGNRMLNEALAGQPKHGPSPAQLNQPSPETQPRAVLNYNQSQNTSENSSESEPKTPSTALPTDLSSMETETQIEKICRNCGSKNKKRFENRTMLCNTCGMYKRRTGKHRPEECWKRRTDDVQKEEEDDCPGWKKLTKCVNCGEARRRRASFEREYRCSKCHAYKMKFKRERPKHLWNNSQYQKKSDYKKKESPITGLDSHLPYQPPAVMNQNDFGVITKPPSCMNCGSPCTNFPENWQKPECGPCVFYKNNYGVPRSVW
ncbi:hypothetical protein B9Z55_016466 [Caenorhabditis nigoni]|uniref:GATA-type domain-containing protein n=1 Tax=Caenorhabditis nigoni TaxID=1611254 RepID=A0A2G5T5M3_9PELO|nr:hypothetical protein B9Z55_016466 [Caenorhabditis nigoni]